MTTAGFEAAYQQDAPPLMKENPLYRRILCALILANGRTSEQAEAEFIQDSTIRAGKNDLLRRILFATSAGSTGA